MFSFFIVLIFLIAFYLRVLYISQGAVSFHYDMARDAFIANSIWQNFDFKLIGPPTTVDGLYHGVLYYYLIAPAYAIGQGDPRYLAYFLAFLNSLALIPIALLAKDIFKDKKWILLSMILFAVSFEASQYATWLSNPTPAVLTMALFFYGLRLWQKNNKFGLPLAATAAALSAQFQFFLIFLFFLLPIFYYIFRPKLVLKQIISSILLVVLVLSTFIISAIKFNTIPVILNAFGAISVGSQQNSFTPFTDLVLNYINRFADIFINNFLPINMFLGGVFAFIVLYISRAEKFILFCLLANLPIYFFGGHNSVYTSIGMVTPAILGVVLLIKKIYQQNIAFSRIIVFLIVVSNIYMIAKTNVNGQTLFVIPKSMLLNRQLAIIDKTYELANGQPFAVNSLTLPLWTNTTWAYLYNWYGKQKYGYVPSFYGRNQVGLLGADVLKQDQPMDKNFYIIEPANGIPGNFYNDELATEESKTKLIQSFPYESITLQFREKINDQ